MNLFDYSTFLKQLVPPPASRAGFTLKRSLDAHLSTGAGGDVVAGDHLMKQICMLLDQFEGYERSDTQKQFHGEFFHASLPHIYGSKDFERFRSRILKQNGLQELRQEILVCTPRRIRYIIYLFHPSYCATLPSHLKRPFSVPHACLRSVVRGRCRTCDGAHASERGRPPS
jgi:hypothetical protein